MNDNINEIWQDIEGYQGLYQVSSLGRVKSLRDNKGNYREKILKLSKDKNGYLLVNLYKDGICKTCKLHRLVAQAFIENPNNYPTVNHKDECKTNNNVTNLEWCTYQFNNTYGTVIQRRVASTDYKAIAAKIDYKEVSRKNAEKLSRQVYQYTLDGNLIKIWNSTAECGRNGYNFGNVSQCCNGERKSHRGFIWSYSPIDSK